MQQLLSIHAQLENLIRDKIASGEYPVGSPLPSERKLAETYGINRLTVRATLKNLQQEGLVVAEHGRGNFVCSSKVRVSFATIRGFGAQLKQQGVHHVSRVLYAQKVPAGYAISRKFDLPRGTDLFRLIRVRIGNGRAVAIDDTYIPYTAISGVEEIDFATHSLYTALEANHVQLANAQQQLTIRRLQGEWAAALEVPENAPVFCVEHCVFDENRRMIEHTLSYVNPDRSTISSYLK